MREITLEHRIFVGSKAWRNYIKAGKKPADIPSAPWRTYKKYWTGWGDWLGTGIIASFNKKFRTYTSSRAFVRGLRIKSIAEWRKYAKSGKKPIDIPSNPDSYYTTEWKDWGEFLGTGFVAFKDRKYQDFEKARKFIHQLAFRSREDWTKYAMSKSRPQNIPADPSKIYKDNWKGWGDWLGTGTLAPKNKKFLPFKDARIVVQSQHLGSIAKWSEYIKQGSKPYNIPSNPDNYYNNEWKSWGDWLGTGTIAVKDRVYLSFQEAKEFVHILNLTSQPDWFQYDKTNKKPDNIPANPASAYNSEWISWPDWLGYEEKLWSIKKVKELLRDLIESNIIYGWDEAVLYSLLLRKGLLNLSSGTRHKEFFKNFVEAVKTVEGRKSINEYAYSDSENIPDLFGIKEGMKTKEGTDEIQLATSEDLTSLPNSDPLEYGTHHAVEQILHNTLVLESINIDEEAIQFYLSYSVGELWKLAFQNEQKTVNEIRLSKKYENKYSKAVVESFLATYYGIKEIKLPTRYSFPYPPTLMQLYVAYKVKSLPYFGNFSATGAGKTLSAIISSRILESKMTVIVCPNDVVDQWRRNILEVFPDSQVITGKESFFTTYTEKDYKYLVLNYDKFSQEDSPNLILNLGKQQINFVVLDEIHFTKIRDEDEISKRRKNLDGLMTLVRKKNPNVKVLGLSATPVVNNLREGKSLLELITGKIYDDVATKPTIPNAVTLYEKLSTLSIRELPKYSVDLDTQVIDVVAQRPPSITVRYLKTNPLSIEKILTDARIPEIVKQIEGQCIIYTEYVEDIVKKISKAVENAGFTFALYTGSDRSGLTKFLDKKVQVLIASRPLSVGVDGLQHICNRLIINTLPWTNAQYQQLLGRLVRKGQIRDVVHVYLIKASIGGYQYDELKWKRIQFKRTLADCAVDGVLPERNLVTPQQAAMEAVKWLERLERGEISTVIRKDLNVELSSCRNNETNCKVWRFYKT